jgi:hypothetical protein
MAKRGRKPKEKKGYFYDEEEQAIVAYINSENKTEKNRIFNKTIYPALTKMIESIIRRYKLFVPDEEFEQNFSDTISYLLTKINHFKPVIIGYDPYTGSTVGLDIVDMDESVLKGKIRNASEEDPEYVRVYGYDYDDNYRYEHKILEPNVVNIYKKTEHKYKAYSYCGTVCKNYLMYKCTQYNKNKLKNTSYEDIYDDLSNDERYSFTYEENKSVAERLIDGISDEIESQISEPIENNLNENEVKVGEALVNLLRNWENVLPGNGSNKLQKSSVLYYLREYTDMTTKELRENMKSFKTAYNLLKATVIE